MTDKEFKELCEWAKTLNNENVYVAKYEKNSDKTEWISVGNCWFESLKFYKDGKIYGEEDIISENRTAKQMKAIIENLL